MTRGLGRILVTGSRGFLGSALIKRLAAKGHPATASDLDADSACDLTDAEAVDSLVARGFDTVFHCGAVSGPMVMADRPLDVWRINAGGTANILEAARRHGCGRVIVCSTSEVYGRRQDSVDEDTPPGPPSVYGASKLAAEAAVNGYASEGVDAVALRLSWIYGPGRKTPTTLNSVMRSIAATGRADVAGRPDDPTHYLFIDDAVQGLLCAAGADHVPRCVYNITAGKAVPLIDVMRRVEAFVPGARIVLREAPPSPSPACIASTAARRDLGFEVATSLETGLMQTWEQLSKSC